METCSTNNDHIKNDKNGIFDVTYLSDKMTSLWSENDFSCRLFTNFGLKSSWPLIDVGKIKVCKCMGVGAGGGGPTPPTPAPGNMAPSLLNTLWRP